MAKPRKSVRHIAIRLFPPGATVPENRHKIWEKNIIESIDREEPQIENLKEINLQLTIIKFKLRKYILERIIKQVVEDEERSRTGNSNVEVDGIVVVDNFEASLIQQTLNMIFL